jgi:hypothetical protein
MGSRPPAKIHPSAGYTNTPMCSSDPKCPLAQTQAKFQISRSRTLGHWNGTALNHPDRLHLLNIGALRRFAVLFFCTSISCACRLIESSLHAHTRHATSVTDSEQSLAASSFSRFGAPLPQELAPLGPRKATPAHWCDLNESPIVDPNLSS